MQVAVVTGASSGIGQGAAVEIGRRGIGVIVTYNANREGALETVAMIEKVHGRAVALPLDVGRSETFGEFRDQVLATLRSTWQRDSFDFLVNNAGVGGSAMITDTTEEQFDRFYRVLLKGPYFLTQKLVPHIADGGAIVNVSSGAAASWGEERGYSAYASMKGGVNTLTRYMAMEFSERRIRVNAVSPGVVRTRLGGDAFAKHPEYIPPIAARTAFGRIGEQDDLGLFIAALVGEESRWVTAQNIEVSGGYNL